MVDEPTVYEPTVYELTVYEEEKKTRQEGTKTQPKTRYKGTKNWQKGQNPQYEGEYLCFDSHMQMPTKLGTCYINSVSYKRKEKMYNFSHLKMINSSHTGKMSTVMKPPTDFTLFEQTLTMEQTLTVTQKQN